MFAAIRDNMSSDQSEQLATQFKSAKKPAPGQNGWRQLTNAKLIVASLTFQLPPHKWWDFLFRDFTQNFSSPG